MTDYLEQMLERSAHVLLREQQRMDGMVLVGGWSWERAEDFAVNEEEKTAAAEPVKQEQPKRWDTPAFREEAALQQGGTPSAQGLRRAGWQRLTSQTGALFAPMDETAAPLAGLEDRAQSLPLQRQMVRSGQILTAAQAALPAQWSATALRKRGGYSGGMEIGREGTGSWLADSPLDGTGRRPGTARFGGEAEMFGLTQRVDRDFRRDSRRYDNGFFLY